MATYDVYDKTLMSQALSNLDNARESLVKLIGFHLEDGKPTKESRIIESLVKMLDKVDEQITNEYHKASYI